MARKVVLGGKLHPLRLQEGQEEDSMGSCGRILAGSPDRGERRSRSTPTPLQISVTGRWDRRRGPDRRAPDEEAHPPGSSGTMATRFAQQGLQSRQRTRLLEPFHRRCRVPRMSFRGLTCFPARGICFFFRLSWRNSRFLAVPRGEAPARNDSVVALALYSNAETSLGRVNTIGGPRRSERS